MKRTIQCPDCGTENCFENDAHEGHFFCENCGEGINLSSEEEPKESVDDQHLSDQPSAAHSSGGNLQIGKFQVVRRLAQGGMGDIYLARLSGAEGFEKEVALKVLHSSLASDKDFAKTIVDEAKLTVLLHHPNIVQVYNLEKTGGQLFLVMEFVTGKSLQEIQKTYRRQGKIISPPMAIYIASEVLEGLAYAHEMTDHSGRPLMIVHRDISPQNILVTKDGWVKIIDFGIAKAANRLSQTTPGVVKGKFAYLSPEQIKGQCDHRSDLYSLGVVLWEMLAGQGLFRGTTQVDTMKKVLHMKPPRIGNLKPDHIPKEIDQILDKSLEKDPAKRFGSAREFREALLRLVAPMGLEELRANVDLSATQEGPAAISRGKATRSSELGSAHAGGQRPSTDKARRYWIIGLCAILLATIGFGGWLGLRLIQTRATGSSDGGMSKEPGPTDAGMVLSAAESKTRELEKRPEDRIQSKPVSPKKLGSLNSNTINRILQMNAASFQRCADGQLSGQGSNQKIELVLNFTIMPEGKVSDVAISPEHLQVTSFGKCLSASANRMKFPPHEGKPIVINFPLKFQILRK